MDSEKWRKAHQYTPEQEAAARSILEELRHGRELHQAMRRYPQPGGGYLPKHLLVAVYRQLVESGEWPADPALLERIRMKPVRTLSGVTTVTVLTKPYPCPGDCIFCPTEERQPKSYISDEPGARRALENNFDPFAQVDSRLRALAEVGHPTDKVELLILGGSWSAYPRDYQKWFIHRCFEAMNGCESASLEEAHQINENAAHRNVGLVIETRPDLVTPEELAWLRSLGVTKVQMGAQSLDDVLLVLNRRDHTVADTLRACTLLRAGGFKIVLHWMPNLLGATPESDREDFARLWMKRGIETGFCPDEIKIYPCQLLANTELYHYWERGEYQPYDEEVLTELVADVKAKVPRYCRINRIIRDIPSNNVVAGNKRTSLRQDVQANMTRRKLRCQCIRCREVREKAVLPGALKLEEIVYYPAQAEEHFISFVTPDDHLAGYLRLSLPEKDAPNLGLADLDGAAIIREVHVYGQSLQVGSERTGAAQHVGLGSRLIELAAEKAYAKGFRRLAVIAAIGTRRYYRARGFADGQLYMVRDLTIPDLDDELEEEIDLEE
ncbi:MAG TPA: tRNA uridine(34) 5-carboxymethylaminomethyl modification radical SAM/GNAT enzyme Elp3 [Anaerolineaceae bacterium]|nr:tRNA uridine(34) 5-carboxymethylaminomethyl modification radical SAM/GNAT enzyme Elp3 [Anaerolineaceae bacterium]HPN52693.1 tRNA uridine(34) 5-carboxymethylaminomethyl modification radical SAM/GNAT enzyme Elp3 [Anaerolineaceae bacterium]